MEALRSAAAASGGSAATPHHRGSNASSGGPPHTPGGPNSGGGGFGAHRSSTASLSDELRKHMADSYHLDYGRGGGGSIAGGLAVIQCMPVNEEFSFQI